MAEPTPPVASTPEWAGKVLPVELLPRIISHLSINEPKDLPTLLIIQKSCQAGWDAVTPLLYRDVTIKDWSKFLPLPTDVDPNTKLSNDWNPKEHLNELQTRSLLRRWKACTFTHNAVFQALPARSVVLFHDLASVCIASSPDHPQTLGRKLLFPNVKQLRITSSAWVDYAHGGRLAKIEPDERGDLFHGDQPHPADIQWVAAPTKLCIELPQAAEEETYGIVRRQLEATNTEISKLAPALGTLLPHIPTGADIFIHNMLGMWSQLSVGDNGHKYHWFYANVSRTALSQTEADDAGITDSTLHFHITRFRAMMYFDMLLITSNCPQAAKILHSGPDDEVEHGEVPPETMAIITEKLDKMRLARAVDRPCTTWRIIGETNYVKGDEKSPERRTKWSLMMRQLVGSLKGAGLEGELEAAPQDDPRSYALQLFHGVNQFPKRIAFAEEGEEEACPCCGQC